MIVSKKYTEDFLRNQKDVNRWITSVSYPQTKIAKALNVTRQTVYRRFKNSSWTGQDFLKVLDLINSKK